MLKEKIPSEEVTYNLCNILFQNVTCEYFIPSVTHQEGKFGGYFWTSTVIHL